MESKKDHRIFNQIVLLSFNSATTPQQTEQRINCPFPTKKIVFHAPNPQIITANLQHESYIIQSSLNRDGVGVVGYFSGESITPSAAARPITVAVNDPMQVNGLHTFSIRGFAEATGGAAVPITAKILLVVEFHSEL